MEKYILVDTSYMCYYRFFAVLNWYRNANKEEFAAIQDKDKYDWSNDTKFMTTYKRMFFKSIEKLFGKKFIKDTNIIFCCDPGNCDLWRKEIYKDYKGNRADMSLKNNLYPVFDKTLDEIIPELMEANCVKNISMIKIAKIEADDIIAYLSDKILKNNSENQIIILSADDDFTQLLNENIKLIDFRKKTFKEISDEESKKLLLEKILNGDKSDNIKKSFEKN